MDNEKRIDRLEVEIQAMRKDFYERYIDLNNQLIRLSAKVAVYSALGAGLPSFLYFLWQVFKKSSM
jgi:hypothetical protein